MPTHKSKKSSSARSSVEKSKETDLKSLSDFVDDRVELIRHAFMCLKPKTIKNIAPEFLKGKSIDKLQEICLDEVLGLSKKRLFSIINATACPSDTESSDSDAPKIIEDHISLSEISSDDDMLEEINSKKVKKLHKKRHIKKEKNPEVKKMKNGRSEASTSAGKKPENKMSEKEMTVLELLELQARARAIRSQLALEPVTKIELDSDESGNEKEKTVEKAPTEVPVVEKPDEAPKKNASSETSKEKEKPKSGHTKSPKASTSTVKETETSKEPESRPKSKEPPLKAGSSKDHHSSGAEDRHKSDKKKRSKRSSRSRSRSKEKQKSPILDLRAKIELRRSQNQSMEDKTSESGDKPRRRVVLKRNFGSQITVTTENNKTSNDTSTSVKKDEPKSATSEKVKQEQESDRESSPDVIAMHPSPETILLTSSDEEQESASINDKLSGDKKRDTSQEKSPPKKVTEKPSVSEKPRSPIREKSPGTLSLEAEELDYDEKMSETESEHPQELLKAKSNEQSNDKSDDKQDNTGDKKSHSDSDSEEEERDDWEDTIDEEVEKVSSHLSDAAPSQEINDKPDDSISISNSQTSLTVQESETASEVAQAPPTQPENSPPPTATISDVVDVDELPEKIGSSSSSSSSSSDSENESEEEQPNTSKKNDVECPRNAEKDPESADDADVVTIDINESSDDGKLNEEQENNQSWGQRWLRSKKVSKVMTSTKLGNKLRSKAKEKKIEEKKAIEEKERLEKLEQERLAEEERKKVEEEKKATEVPEDVLGSTKHFKDLKLLSMLKEEREQRAAKETARKTKKK